MAPQGSCCFGLRGATKAVGNLFLVYTLMELLGVIVAWAVLVAYPTNVQRFGVDTSEGQFGVKLRETQSVLRGRGEDVTVNLGKVGGSISSDGQHSSLPGLEGMPAGLQIHFICSTVYVLLALMFNSMLIHGTDHNLTCAVLAWLVFYGAVFVLMSLSSVGSLIIMTVLLQTGTSNETRLGLYISAGVGLLVCPLLWFLWALVLTFYRRELRHGTRGYKYPRDLSLEEPPLPPPPPAAYQKAEAWA